MNRRYDLYVVTDETLSRSLSHSEIAAKAVEGGADVIQLRDKSMPGRELYNAAVSIRKITAESDALFIVNDRADIALLSQADGVHLGQSDVPIEVIRCMVPEDFIVGISASTVDEAVEAEKKGADYIGLGPIFPTASKCDAAAVCGLEMLRDARKKISIPIVAIGGIGPGNVDEVIRAGADGAAVISAVVSQADVTKAARMMKERIIEAKALNDLKD